MPITTTTKNTNKEQELKYEIVLFKKKGHSTWRIDVSSPQVFLITAQKNKTEITDMKLFEINRITGDFKEIKK